MENELTKETITHLMAVGFYGTDANLETSLFEYDFICRDIGPDEIQIIYYLPCHDKNWSGKWILFGVSSATRSDCIEAIDKYGSGFLSSLGLQEADKADYLTSATIRLVSDIQNYMTWFDWNYPSHTLEDLATWPALENNTV